MAIRVSESPDSRDIHFGSQGGGQTLRFTAVTTAGETEAQVYLAALAGTSPFFNGFIRNDLKVIPKGAKHVFTVEVEYGTTGVGGGDQPLGGAGSDGGPPTTPSAPASESTPLTGGWSFTIQAPTLHLVQSRRTVQAVGRNGAPASDYNGRIGVDRDGRTLGCDVPPAAPFTFSRTIARATVTQAYLNTLSRLAGKPNNAAFYGWAEGEVLFVSANGQYTQGEGWSITYQFGVQKNENLIVICSGLPAPADSPLKKKGWEYLWILEVEMPDPTTQLPVTVPSAAYVEEVLEPVDFTLLEIGA